MKKTGLKIGALLLTAVFILTGCGASKDKGSTSDSGSKMKVYATFYPMYDFSKRIGGDKVDVKNLIPAGTEPHDWEPSPQDLVDITKAKVLVYNGAGMENWIDKVSESVDSKNLEIVEASKGVKLLKASEEEHNDKQTENHEHGGYDPHVWLNPENAIIEMKNIKDAFSKADPENKDYYEANFKKESKIFNDLNNKYKTELSKTKSKTIVVAHEAFGYLCKAYGLEQMGIEGLSPDSEPDAAKMAEISDFAKKNHVKYIFFEDLVSPKVAKTIAKEAGAQTAVLNPIEGLTEAQLKAGDNYVTIMEKNLDILLKALN